MTRRLPGERRLGHLGRLALSVMTSCIIAVAPTAFGLSFGGEQVTSYLGQPLRLAIPLLGATAGSLEPGCFRVVVPARADGLAVISQARIELQTSSNPPLLIVRSNRVVDDPVVRVSVEAGCDDPIRRDYTVLLDPQPLPVADTSNRPPSLVTPPASSGENVTALPAAISSAAVGSGSARAVGRAVAERGGRSDRTARSSTTLSAAKRSPRLSSDGVSNISKSATDAQKSLRMDRKTAATQQDQLRVQDGSGVGSPTVGDASLAALAVPRLKIASDLPSFESALPGTAKATDELQAAIASERRARLLNAPIEQDLSPRLEADLVVAKRRLAELQSQLSAAGLTPKSESMSASGNSANGNASVKGGNTPTSGGDWNWREWVWIPGVLLVLGLLGFLWQQKRSQQAAPQFATVDARATRSDDSLFEPTPAAEGRTAPQISEFAPVVATPVPPATVAIAPPSPVLVNPLLRTPATAIAEREASDRLNNPLFQLRDTTRHVDVTELSQVTDEAQVYVDLGRSDQAIEILRDHIEHQQSERDSPAAWLMIFDLYRRTNNRAGYDELAPQFRTHFNGRMPDWDNYGHELALDDGLEAFPHLVAVLQRDWGTPEARKFLEELLYDNRGGSRLGFSLAAYRDILLLLQVHDAFDSEQSSVASIIDWESRGANDDDGTPKWDLSLEMLDPPKAGELEAFLRNRPADDKS